MRLLKKSATALLVLGTIGAINPVHAQERNWDDGYRLYQDQAANFVQVEIINVSVSYNKTLWFASASDRVEIEARILKVFRTKDNLSAGMLIPIVYDRKAAAGGTFAETPGIPEKGSVVPAFIKRKGDRFIPAARHHTFSPLTEQQIARMKEKPEFLDPEQIAALGQPDTVLGAAEMDTRTRLPLKEEEPAIAAATTPEVEIAENAASPDMESFVAPPVMNPDALPESSPTSVAEPAISTTTTLENPSNISDGEKGDTSKTSRPILAPMPHVVPPDPKAPREKSRRTVVVIPPSEIKARRQAQQASPPILSEPEPELMVDVPEIESVPPDPLPPAPPVVEPPRTEAPAPRATVVENPIPENPDNSELVVRSTVPAFSIREPEPPAMRAEIVAPEAEVMPAAEPATELIETQPVLTIDSPEQPGTLQHEVPIEEITQTETETPELPATPIQPQEEPIAITDFTPTPSPTPQPTPTPEPSPSPALPPSDQENMKTYAGIYGILQNAESKRATKNLDEAKTLYENALSGLQNLKKNFPDFQPFMVEYRIRDTGRKLEEVMMQINRSPDNQPDQP